jgi:hypothetical protein
MRLSLYEHPDGVESEDGNRVVFDLAANEAHFGAARVDGPALEFELGDGGPGASLSVEVELDRRLHWLIRCDRIDFPPGGIAYRHTHPGPGIRYLLHGSIRIESGGETHDYTPGEPWFESGPEPVLATASATEDSAFVRVLLLPPEWAGKRTIRYVDPADEDRPKLQRPTVYGEYPIAA